MATRLSDDRHGIQSIEVGFRLLDVLAKKSHPMMLRDIAKGAGMPAAKAHRYMISFMRIGLVEQDRINAHYDLGSYALQLGLSGLGRMDTVRLAGPILEALCEEIQETVALAVWGNNGATVVRVVDTGGPVTITLRTGTVLPLFSSATGRAFVSFYRGAYLKKLLEEELHRLSETSKVAISILKRQLEKNLTEIRKHGISRATGSLTHGINGFSAPVFDHSGSMVAAITSLGTIGDFDVEWDSPLATSIISSANKLSLRLGYDKNAVAADWSFRG
jgi:DNA-binding IclR family transcriptional regulator